MSSIKDNSLLSELIRTRDAGDFDTIAKTDAFSAVVSGMATAVDFRKMRFQLLSVGISERNCATNAQVSRIAICIAAQIAKEIAV